MSGTTTIYRVTIDTSSFHGLAASVDEAEDYAFAAAQRERGVEFVMCDTDTGEWLGAVIILTKETS